MPLSCKVLHNCSSGWATSLLCHCFDSLSTQKWEIVADSQRVCECGCPLSYMPLESTEVLINQLGLIILFFLLFLRIWTALNELALNEWRSCRSLWLIPRSHLKHIKACARLKLELSFKEDVCIYHIYMAYTYIPFVFNFSSGSLSGLHLNMPLKSSQPEGVNQNWNELDREKRKLD